MADAATHGGSCHCGAVQFEVEVDLTGAMECNCSHCYRKGFILAFTPAQKFTLRAGEGALREYLFNHHAIRHQFCTTCGVEPFAYGKNPKTGEDTVAVNLRTLTDVEPWSLTPQRVDGRSF